MSLDFRKFWSVDWILFKNILIKIKIYIVNVIDLKNYQQYKEFVK